MSVSAVIVTFNRIKLLKECIYNLLNQSSKLDYIFVVNNNSSDGTKSYLMHMNNKHVIPINLNNNLGGAGGFNKGIKYAFNHSRSDYFWIMDDDTMPTSNALKELLKKAKFLKNNFGFLCSNVRWWKNNEPCNMPAVSKDWTKLSKESLIKLKHATFVSVLIPRKNVADLGLPIKEMFIWGDDTEYTTRLSSKLDSYFVSSSIVLHKSASNGSYENVFNATRNRIKFYKYMFRNLIYIDRKYYSSKRNIYDMIRFIFYLFEMPFKAKTYRFLRFKDLFESIINGLTFHPKIEFPKVKISHSRIKIK